MNIKQSYGIFVRLKVTGSVNMNTYNTVIFNIINLNLRNEDIINR